MDKQEIIKLIGEKFPTFGGGNLTNWNPISVALKDQPLAFAGGVDVEQVVDLILDNLTRDNNQEETL